MKLDRKDLYFVVTYYLEELNGKYPLVETINGKTDETMFYLLRHYLRSILKVRSTKVEMQVIDVLRDDKKNNIIRTGMAMFPEWRQRADSHDRILMIAKQLLHIKALARAAVQEAIAPPTKDGGDKTKGDGASIQKDVSQPQYSSIQEYTDATGKRFRMTKDQKARGLDREAAFREMFGE